MENKEIVRHSYELFAEGKLAEAAEFYAPDAVWTVPGQNALTGTYKGRDAIVTKFLQKLFVLSGGTYRASLMDVAEGDGYTFALQHSQAERDGNSIDYLLCNVIRIEDGLIRTVHTYPWDPRAQDTFWHKNLLRKPDYKSPVAGDGFAIAVPAEAAAGQPNDVTNMAEYEDIEGGWF